MSNYNTFYKKSNDNRKHLNLLFLYFMLLTFIFSSFIQAFDQQTNQSRERTISANRQLQDYHSRLEREAAKQQVNKQGLAPAKVGINIDKIFKKSSHIIFYDDMEGGTNGWSTVAYTNYDIWNQTTLESCSPTKSWWAGIEQQANYNNGSRINNALVSPTINLTGKTAPIKLLFTENYVTESGWDFCMVDVSTDAGITWERLRGGYGNAPSGDSYGWTVTALDISAYAGKDIQIRFYFDTGDGLYNDFPGWFVDDVIIFDESGMITGKKFFDINNNSFKDIGERGIKNWLITATGEGISLTTRTN